MDITWHLGAHRTGTTSTQQMFLREARQLRAARVAVWGPRLTRAGYLAGLLGPAPKLDSQRERIAELTAQRIRSALRALREAGQHRLILSDENILGGMAQSASECLLYSDVGVRLIRLAKAIGPPDKVYLTIRAQPDWWRSVLTYQMVRGGPLIDDGARFAIGTSRRGWADVVNDVRIALPDSLLIVRNGVDPAGTFRDLTGQTPLRPCPQAGPSIAPSLLRERLECRGQRVPDWIGQDRLVPFSRTLRRKMLQMHRLDLDRLAASAHRREIVLRDTPTARHERQGGAAPWQMEPSPPDMRSGRASLKANFAAGRPTT